MVCDLYDKVCDQIERKNWLLVLGNQGAMSVEIFIKRGVQIMLFSDQYIMA